MYTPAVVPAVLSDLFHRLEQGFDGNGTESSIVIKKDGSTVIKAHGTTGSSLLYKGKFSNPITLKNGEGWLFKDNKVFALSNG